MIPSKNRIEILVKGDTRVLLGVKGLCLYLNHFYHALVEILKILSYFTLNQDILSNFKKFLQVTFFSK